ncbi:MAG: hypothetical protein R2742_05755 [Micropruina glycogenica]
MAEFTHEGVDGFLVAVEVGVQGVDAGGEAVRFGAGDPGQGGVGGRLRQPAMRLMWTLLIPLRASDVEVVGA